MTQLYLSVDVEEYFHAENLRPAAPPHSWDDLPSRVEGQTLRLLEVLAECQARATFFVLGWVAERHPDLVRRIRAAGHEVASHGYGHVMITQLDPPAFRADVRRARAILEDACGEGVFGYRAPTWSITPQTAWALDILRDEDHLYDSSIFPVRHDRYGWPGAPHVPHTRDTPGGPLAELPPLVLRLFGRSFPAAGGGYLRLLPYAYTNRAIQQAARAGRPAILYLHPWELDPDQPQLAVSGWRRLRHYRGLRRVEPRVRRMLSTYPASGALMELIESAYDTGVG